MVAAFVVGRAIDNARYLAPGQSSGAHQARLHGDVDGAVNKIFSAKHSGGRGDGLHLGMGSDVGECFGEVVRACYHLSVAHYHGTDWHLVGLRSQTRLVERHLHKSFVVVANSHCVWVIRGNTLVSRGWTPM